jgi:hypothetical protein
VEIFTYSLSGLSNVEMALITYNVQSYPLCVFAFYVSNTDEQYKYNFTNGINIFLNKIALLYTEYVVCTGYSEQCDDSTLQDKSLFDFAPISCHVASEECS